MEAERAEGDWVRTVRALTIKARSLSVRITGTASLIDIEPKRTSVRGIQPPIKTICRPIFRAPRSVDQTQTEHGCRPLQLSY